MEHDLCQCRAEGWNFPFPAQYRGVEGKQKLVVELKLAALKAGSCLSTKCYRSIVEKHNHRKTRGPKSFVPIPNNGVNHERLYVCTMDLRTTSISESMHWSMKSGFDGVRAGMDTVTAANTMMDKSDRRLEAIQKENAMQERRSQKFSSLPTAGHLTEFCQKEVERQWGRRGLYVVVQANVDQGEWCRCVCLGFDGTRNSNESWLSIEEEQDPRVIEAKHLYELTWVQKRVAVKGIPLPGTNVAAEEQDAVFEVECHVPDTIQELQRSQQVAVTPLKKKSTKKAMWMEKIRQAMDMAAGKDDEEFMESCVNHMHSGMTGRVTTRRGERKRSSEYVFPETGKSKQRVEKRKNNVGQF